MDFTENYKNHSNADLQQIINNPNDYQPSAVEAAKTIIAGRQLNEDDWELLKAELAAQQKEIELQNQKKKAFDDKVKNAGTAIIDTINPIQSTPRSANKTIVITSIVLGLIALLKIYQEFWLLKYILEGSDALDAISILYFVPVVLLSTATFLFWRRIKAGWLLLFIYLANNVIGAMILVLWQLFVQPSGYNVFDNFSLLTFLWTIVFNGGLLWVICKENIRTIYTISKQNILASIGVSLALTALTIAGIYI